MAKLAKVSRFGPPIYTKLEAILKASPEITTRFSAIARPRARFVDLRTFKAFQSNGSSVQILFLVELISLFSPITFLVLIHLLEACYGKKSYKIDIHLSILEPLKLMEREEIESTPYYVRSLEKRDLFFEYSGFNPITVRARVFNY